MKKALLRPKATGTVSDIVLDEQKYYFGGDHVRGRLVITPSKPIKLTGIRLEFYGHIKTYINIRKQDGHYFFRELFPLDIQPGILKSGETYTFPFEFCLPVETTLPSCTEIDTNTGGMIEYVIKATTDRPSRDAITTCFHLPVLERLDVTKPGMLKPVRDKVTWQSQYPEDIIDQDEYHGVDQVDFSATIPHKGYTRDQEIPVTVDIHHFRPYYRTNGLVISLIRRTRILCKEKAYVLVPTVIQSINADIDIQHTTGQTITKSLLIPRYISPTITLDSQLMQVDYHIEVRADLDESDITMASSGMTMMTMMTMMKDKRQGRDVDLTSMRLELPVIIGTLPSSPSTLPPDVLNPKFVKGVKHIGEENNAPRSFSKSPSSPLSSNSLFGSFDFSSIPSTLLEISSANLRGDSYSRYHINHNRSSSRQQQPTWSPPGSIDDTNPLSPTLSAASTDYSSLPSKKGISTATTASAASASAASAARTARTSSLLSPTSTIPTVDYTKELPSPFHLTLSLGEPFDILGSTFHSGNTSTKKSTLDQVTTRHHSPEPTTTDIEEENDTPRSGTASTRDSTLPEIVSVEDLAPSDAISSASSSQHLDHAATFNRNNIDTNSTLLSGSATASINAAISPPPLPQHYTSSTTSSSNSANFAQPNDSTTTSITAPPPPPKSQHNVNPAPSSRSNTDSTQLSGSATASITATPSSPTSPHPSSPTTSSRNSKLSAPSIQPTASPTPSINTSSPPPSPPSPPSPPPPPPQSDTTTPSSINANLLLRCSSSVLPEEVKHPITTFDDSASSSYRRVSTFSNYHQTASSLTHGEEYKPESTIEGLEETAARTIQFDKPHEMVYTDSDDDDDSDDFISILARREKKEVSPGGYWH